MEQTTQAQIAELEKKREEYRLQKEQYRLVFDYEQAARFRDMEMAARDEIEKLLETQWVVLPIEEQNKIVAMHFEKYRELFERLADS